MIYRPINSFRDVEAAFRQVDTELAKRPVPIPSIPRDVDGAEGDLSFVFDTIARDLNRSDETRHTRDVRRAYMKIGATWQRLAFFQNMGVQLLAANDGSTTSASEVDLDAVSISALTRHQAMMLVAFFRGDGNASNGNIQINNTNLLSLGSFTADTQGIIQCYIFRAFEGGTSTSTSAIKIDSTTLSALAANEIAIDVGADFIFRLRGNITTSGTMYWQYYLYRMVN